MAHFARTHQIFLEEDVYFIGSLSQSRGILINSGSHGLKVLDPATGALQISISFPAEAGEFPIFTALEAEDSGLLYVFSHEIPSRVICVDTSRGACTMVTGAEHLSLPAGWSLTEGPVVVLDHHGVWWCFSGTMGRRILPPEGEVERLQTLRLALEDFEEWAFLQRRAEDGGVVALNPSSAQVAWFMCDGSKAVISLKSGSPVGATICGGNLLALSESQLIARCGDHEIQLDISGPDFYFVAINTISDDPPQFLLLASAQDNRTSRLDLYAER